MEIGEEYLNTVRRRVLYYRELGEKTMEQLSEQEFHYRPNEESNSIAMIIRHMHGNMMSRWTNFLSEDGEKEWRNRDDEFEVHHTDRSTVIKTWNEGWDCFLNALDNLQPGDLLSPVTIRNEKLTVIDAINRQLAHYPYHIGQIIYIGKLLKDAEWQNLSIPKGGSAAYNANVGPKDPAK